MRVFFVFEATVFLRSFKSDSAHSAYRQESAVSRGNVALPGVRAIQIPSLFYELPKSPPSAQVAESCQRIAYICRMGEKVKPQGFLVPKDGESGRALGKAECFLNVLDCVTEDLYALAFSAGEGLASSKGLFLFPCPVWIVGEMVECLWVRH